jgi:hypothetical protein
MDSLHRDVLALIETCRLMTGIPKKLRPSVGAATTATAAKILSAARQIRPHDAVLASLSAEQASFSWWSLLYVAEAVNRSLPLTSIDRRAVRG